MKLGAISFATAAALTAIIGCNSLPSPRVSVYSSQELADDPPRRVVVVAPEPDTCGQDESLIIAENIAMALERNGRFDVIRAESADARLAAESGLWRRGRIDAGALVEARDRYRADAFLFSSVTSYKSYDPPCLGLKLRLLSVRTGDALWAADALFDAAEAPVREQAQKYFRESGMRESLYGENLVFMSMRLFSHYVANEMTASLVAPPAP